MWPHIHSFDTVVAVVSVTFTAFWFNADVGSVDETTEDNRELAVGVVTIMVGVDSLAVVVVVVVVDASAVARGLPHTTLRLPFIPPKIMNTWKIKCFFRQNDTNFSNTET